MKTRLMLAAIVAGCVSATTIAADHDYHKYLPYPKELLPEVGRDKIEQEGGPDAVGSEARQFPVNRREIPTAERFVASSVRRNLKNGGLSWFG